MVKMETGKISTAPSGPGLRLVGKWGDRWWFMMFIGNLSLVIAIWRRIGF